MALVIPEYLWTKKYSAKRDRLALAHGGAVQAGVWDATDFKVVQRALGANMSVDVGAGYALVGADSPGNLGLYHVQNDGAANVVVPPSHASLPRIDQVFVEINDSTDGGDSADNAVFNVVAGTPTSGATLDNRNGAGVAPANALRIADVLVPAASATVITANIRDRRPWARGAYYARRVTGTNPATASATASLVDGANFAPRVECSGAPVRISWTTNYMHSAADSRGQVQLYRDGVMLTEAQAQGHVAIAGRQMIMTYSVEDIPPAGSHVYALYFGRAEVGTYTLGVGGAINMVVEEDLRQSAENV